MQLFTKKKYTIESEFNRFFFLAVGQLFGGLVQLFAFFARKQIVCRSLIGQNTWDTAIASDMKVHCNCMDFYGHGVLGNLRENSLADIWNGPIANKFRQKLRNGIFPIAECSKCSAWQMRPKKEQIRIKLPYTLMIENTYKCNYSCTSCHRIPLAKTRDGSHLNQHDIALISKTIKENKISKVIYHVLGEPFLVNDIDEQLAKIRSDNPQTHIFMTTNGSLLNTDRKRNATTHVNNIEFSLDGVDDKSVQKYQVGGDFKKPFANLKALVQYSKKNESKTLIGWRYIMFRWNDSPSQIKQAYALAKEAGVSYILFRPTNTPITGFSIRGWYYHFFGLPLSEAIGIKKVGIGFRVPIS